MNNLIFTLIFLTPLLLNAQALDVAGDIKFGALGGSGTQMVVTDNNGNLGTQTIPSGGGGSSIWSLNGNFAYYNNGNVGIGTDKPTADLYILRPLSVSKNEPTFKIENAGNQTSGSKTGLAVFTTVDGSVGRNGIQNVTSQQSNGSGNFNGIINNNFPGGTGTSYGINNLVANSNNPKGLMYGISNRVTSSENSSSSTYGIYNLVEKKGSGAHYGIYNELNSSSEYALFSKNTNAFGHAAYFEGNVSLTDGKLGIGVNFPSRELEVAGDGRMETLLINTNTQTSTDAIAVSGQYQEGLTILTQYTGSSFQSVYGVKSEPNGLSSSMIIYGVYGRPSFGSGSSTVYGVYATKQTGGSSGSYGLYVNGGAFTTGNEWSPSDARFKNNIRPVKDAISLIRELKPATYSYKQSGKYELLNFPKREQIGFIAQEVEKVLPNLVKDTKVQFEEAVRNPESEERWHEEYKAINYQGFIPLLTQGIKEQQDLVEGLIVENEKLVSEMTDLLEANAQLEQRLARIEALLNQDDTSPVQPLQGAILEQNQPNPTNGITTIRYFIPAAVQHAQLQITTLDGKLVKTISVTERGWQQTELYANQLSEAQYFYTLYVDNQIIETKKMVLLK